MTFWKDWLRGAGFADAVLDADRKTSLPRSERLRLLYDVLTAAESQGGANLVSSNPEMKALNAFLFTPQHRTFNNAWLSAWSTKWYLSSDDLTRVQKEFGAQLALYFAYLQYYTIALYLFHYS